MTKFDFQIYFNTTTFPLKQLKFQWIIFCAIAFSTLKHLEHPNKPMAKNQHLAAAAARVSGSLSSFPLEQNSESRTRSILPFSVTKEKEI